MVKRRGRSWRVTGGGGVLAGLAAASLLGCSFRSDVARPVDREDGGSGAQLPSDNMPSPSGGAQSGSSAAGQASLGQPGGTAGTPSSGGSGGEPIVGGEGGSPVETGDIPSVSQIMDIYRTWEPQTAEPVPISSYIFGLCRLPTLREQEFAESEHGDERYLQDWANAEAVAGIARLGTPPFAPGSVIVKEKYVASATGPELVAIAMMIKREQGFAPARGDWDYAYYEPELGTIQTAEQSEYCSGCHAAAAETDFVFVYGLEPGE